MAILVDLVVFRVECSSALVGKRAVGFWALIPRMAGREEEESAKGFLDLDENGLVGS